MAVVRLTSKKTLPLLLEALRRLSFTQVELAQSTSTSVGRVNKVIAHLQDKDIILRETGRYVVARPNALADLIADQQVIRKTRTYNVAVEEDELQKARDEGRVRYCLQSAAGLEDRELHLIHTQEAQDYLDSLPRGERQIALHQYETTTDTIDDVRTIIDLKSAGERSQAEELAQEQWRTRQ